MLAEAVPDTAMMGIIIQALTMILLLGLTAIQLFRGATGKDGERQVEPTALHAIQSELKEQTKTLNKLDRESGETKTAVGSLGQEIARLRTEEIQGMFKRINAISAESTESKTRIDMLEKRNA